MTIGVAVYARAGELIASRKPTRRNFNDTINPAHQSFIHQIPKEDHAIGEGRVAGRDVFPFTVQMVVGQAFV